MTTKLQDEPLIIFDGACGTTLQEMTIPASAWGDCEGCNEYLNITAPEIITEMHSKFIEAGAMAKSEEYEEAEEMLLASLATLKEGPGSGSRTVYIDLAASYLSDLYRDWDKPASEHTSINITPNSG